MVFAPSYPAPGGESNGVFSGKNGASEKCNEMMRRDDGRYRDKSPGKNKSGTNKEGKQRMNRREWKVGMIMETSHRNPGEDLSDVYEEGIEIQRIVGNQFDNIAGGLRRIANETERFNGEVVRIISESNEEISGNIMRIVEAEERKAQKFEEILAGMNLQWVKEDQFKLQVMVEIQQLMRQSIELQREQIAEVRAKVEKQTEAQSLWHNDMEQQNRRMKAIEESIRTETKQRTEDLSILMTQVHDLQDMSSQIGRAQENIPQEIAEQNASLKEDICQITAAVATELKENTERIQGIAAQNASLKEVICQITAEVDNRLRQNTEQMQEIAAQNAALKKDICQIATTVATEAKENAERIHEIAKQNRSLQENICQITTAVDNGLQQNAEQMQEIAKQQLELKQMISQNEETQVTIAKQMAEYNTSLTETCRTTIEQSITNHVERLNTLIRQSIEQLETLVTEKQIELQRKLSQIEENQRTIAHSLAEHTASVIETYHTNTVSSITQRTEDIKRDVGRIAETVQTATAEKQVELQQMISQIHENQNAIAQQMAAHNASLIETCSENITDVLNETVHQTARESQQEYVDTLREAIDQIRSNTQEDLQAVIDMNQAEHANTQAQIITEQQRNTEQALRY